MTKRTALRLAALDAYRKGGRPITLAKGAK